MDPYTILGVPRGCTSRQAREAFRRLVHRAHPDRGGDGEAFVRLCAAYREILESIDPAVEETARAMPGREAMPPGPGASRADYVAWLRQVAEGSARRRPARWWRKHPERARAGLLALIGLIGALVLWGALALGTRSPSPTARRGAVPRAGRGR